MRVARYVIFGFAIDTSMELNFTLCQDDGFSPFSSEALSHLREWRTLCRKHGGTPPSLALV